MMEVLKEKMNESLNKFQENTNKHLKKMSDSLKETAKHQQIFEKNKQIQLFKAWKWNYKQLKKTQTDRILGMKILEIQIGTTEESFSNRIQV